MILDVSLDFELVNMLLIKVANFELILVGLAILGKWMWYMDEHLR